MLIGPGARPLIRRSAPIPAGGRPDRLTDFLKGRPGTVGRVGRVIRVQASILDYRSDRGRPGIIPIEAVPAEPSREDARIVRPQRPKPLLANLLRPWW